MSFRRTLFTALFIVALPFSGCMCDDDPGSPGGSDDTGVVTPDAGDDTGEEMCGPDKHPDGEGGCTTDPCLPDPCGGLELSNCIIDEGQPRCVCPSGEHLEGDECVTDTACEENSCNGHGTCEETPDGITCTCDTGYAGDFCDACADGWYDDGAGGCTDDPCETKQCGSDQICTVDSGQAVCECPAGTHEDADGACVPDTTCMSNTCNGHGTCSESDGTVSCTCDTGWAPPYCQDCDGSAGYHDDGMGGCTTDPCLPNPCTDANTECAADQGGGFTCECASGYHLENGQCVEDDVCQSGSCSNHGTCSTPGGILECDCDTGYSGDDCSSCDTAAGYHDDGMGGCTTDPCLPNPCTEPNKTTCVSGTGSYTCECDTGYHLDGMGGCTDDPCLPDTCAAQNKACRVVNGTAECYTPDCDDQNSCTDDALVNGSCEHTNKMDGSPCSTDVCLTGQTCQGGQCTGTTPLDCDDQNPCTDDTCDATQGGCVNTPDDTNVPDDSIPCTTDSCSGGLASHTLDDSFCDDGQYCTGDEYCVPSDPTSDAEGCIAQNVPQPPPDPGPCADYGACQESTPHFPLVTEPQGSTCEDGIACTTGETCDSQGQCTGGTLQSGCTTDSTCSSTTSFTGQIDVPLATLDVTVTVQGQDPDVLYPNEPFNIYAVEQRTGAWHEIADYYPSSSPPRIQYSDKMMPGVYDILYLNDSWANSELTHFYLSDSDEDLPHGISYLTRDVIISEGPNTLTVDVPVASLDVTVTVQGQDPDVLYPNEPFDIYAVDTVTGAWHEIADYYPSSSPPRIQYSDKIPPGTYDILYLNDSWANSELTHFYLSDSDEDLPHGISYLDYGVTFDASSSNSVSIDVPVATITPTVTVEGQDPDVLYPNEPFDIYAVDTVTGAWHEIADYYPSSSPPRIQYSDKIPPGTYDILYLNDSWANSELTHFYLSDSDEDLPHGISYLQYGVNFTTSTNNPITIDVPVATITPTVTIQGQDPDVLYPNEPFDIYAVDTVTGAWHEIADYYPSSSPPRIQYSDKLPPGTYDILYLNDSWANSELTHFYLSDSDEDLPHGISYLQYDVDVTPSGTNAINVNVPVASISPTVTVQGQDPDVLYPNEPFDIYAVDTVTRAWHEIADYYPTSSPPRIEYSDKLPPGTYDILYLNDSWANSELTHFYLSDSDEDLPHGISYLQYGVDITETGSNAFTVDVPVASISPSVTVQGRDPDVLYPNEPFDIYAVDTVTRAWHEIADYYPSSSPPRIHYSDKIPPGTYDFLYLNDSWANSELTHFYLSDSDEDLPHAIRHLDRCISIQ